MVVTAPEPTRWLTIMPTGATLRTRPAIQRALIRSWECSQPVRLTVLAIRLLVVVWLLILTAVPAFLPDQDLRRLAGRLVAVVVVVVRRGQQFSRGDDGGCTFPVAKA